MEKVAVLIDNDPIVWRIWEKKAKKKGICLSIFSSIHEFLSNYEGLSKEVTIYIDLDLGNGVSGELESKKIFDVGFMNIFIQTAYSPEDIKFGHWIKGVLDKAPPW